MKRLFSLLLSAVLLFGTLPVVNAAQLEHMQAADKLYELGLVSGTGTDAAGKPIYELDRAPTRSEAITVLVKLLGKAEEAGKGGWDMPFTDVPDWAKNFVGYAYANGLTSGTSATTFGGNDPVTAAQYITFVLKSLGYSTDGDFQWDKAWELSDELEITDGRYNANTNVFLRGDVFLISEAALRVKLKESEQTLAEKLMGAGVFQRKLYHKVYNIPLPELSAEQVYAQCSPAVFYVEVYDSENKAFASGSGFFINGSGLAVTNHHVLEGASRAVITTSDTRKTYEVTNIYDFSAENDWVVMQVDGEGFPWLEIGYPETVVGGANVYAIGSPLGLQNTISQGLISNPNRELDGVTYIQTSAAISHGSSGGALLNKYGHVIGITSAGYDNAQNLNLAMPMTVLSGHSVTGHVPFSALASKKEESKPEPQPVPTPQDPEPTPQAPEQNRHKELTEILKRFINQNWNETINGEKEYLEISRSESGNSEFWYALFYDSDLDTIVINVSYFADGGSVFSFLDIDADEPTSMASYSRNFTIGNRTMKCTGYRTLQNAVVTRNCMVDFYKYEGDFDRNSSRQDSNDMICLGLLFLDNLISRYTNGAYSVTDFGFAKVKW